MIKKLSLVAMLSTSVMLFGCGNESVGGEVNGVGGSVYTEAEEKAMAEAKKEKEKEKESDVVEEKKLSKMEPEEDDVGMTGYPNGSISIAGLNKDDYKRAIDYHEAEHYKAVQGMLEDGEIFYLDPNAELIIKKFGWLDNIMVVEMPDGTECYVHTSQMYVIK